MSSFPYKLHQLLTDIEDNEELSSIISWLPSGVGFRIHKPVVFETFLLTKYFPRQSKLKSFKRQVQYYGFDNLGRGSYSHPSFVRGKRSLCGKIIHKLPMKNIGTKSAMAAKKAASCTGSDSRSASPLSPSAMAMKAFSMPVLSNNLPMLNPQAFTLSAQASIPTNNKGSNSNRVLQMFAASQQQQQQQQQQDSFFMTNYLDQLKQNQLQQQDLHNQAMQQYLRILLTR
ncbi:unnamed protein product [Cylindrotheca closterium]|uniref:HSF-type DNA-binding domain-containing protein n=1 Tax=Cylindrotheca closterium TaxID=2856 RepID=A0AAD2G2P4_9STRA|nr:unnamed protein product [Cylindrotheca closterium]